MDTDAQWQLVAYSHSNEIILEGFVSRRIQDLLPNHKSANDNEASDPELPMLSVKCPCTEDLQL